MVTIYKITNLKNGKNYVGQTVKSIELRWKRHCWSCTAKSKKMAISLAIRKHGKGNFRIEAIDTANTLEEANKKEVFWVNELNCFSPNGYNLKAGGRKYLEVSKSTRKKMSKARLGKIASEETKKRLSKAHMGISPSLETRKKLSDINKGKKPSKQANIAASIANSKSYSFVKPNGQRVVIHNIRNFCKENTLPTNRMSEVATGKRESYKGWSI